VGELTCLYCDTPMRDSRQKVCAEHWALHRRLRVQERKAAARPRRDCPYCPVELTDPRMKTCPDHRKQWQADQEIIRRKARQQARPDRHCSYCRVVLPKVRTHVKCCGSEKCRRAQNAEQKAAERQRWTGQQVQAQRQRERSWREQNPGRVKEKNRAAYLANRERYKQYQREWRNRNPEKFLEQMALHQSKRRAWKLGNDSRRVTRTEWRRILRRARGRCFYCGEQQARLTMDHVVPLARGGRHAIGNLAPACLRCNQSKGALFVTEWRRRRALEAAA
jgi:hypothetical protein